MNLSDLDLGYDRVNFFKINNSEILVATLNVEYMKDLRTFFTNKVKNYQFMPQYKSGQWDGNIVFLTRQGVLPLGLLHEATAKLDELGYKYEVDKELLPKPIKLDDFEKVIQDELINKQHKDKSIVPWDHQWNTAKNLLKARRGITKSATSSGKSFTITLMMKYLLYKKYAKRILLVVPRTDLVVQFQKDAIEYGLSNSDVGMYFGRIKEVTQPIIIGTWQSLQNIKERKFFEQFDVLIVDEAHLAGASDQKSSKKRKSTGTQMRQICDKCVNASWRFGLTGTLPVEELDIRTVVSGIGPVVDEVKAIDLMEIGHVTRLKILIPFLNYDPKIVKQKEKKFLLDQGITEKTKKEDMPLTINFRAECNFIENYIPRFKLISNIVTKRLSKNENILILANSIKFGKNLKKIIEHLNKDKFTKIVHITGQMDEQKRKVIRQEMEDGERLIIIATTSLFSTGISVKNLHAVIFANIGKSKTQVLQAIGRSLRKHTTKKVARVYDICDNLKILSAHASERMQFYASEEFDVEITELQI